MNHRTLFSTLFIAGMFAAPAAFAQDATSAEQQTPPVAGQADASAQEPTSADASATSEQGKTSGDAGMATSASTTSTYDSTVPTDQDKQEGDPTQEN